MSGTQCKQFPLLFRFDALNLFAVPLGREVLLPDLPLAVFLRVLQLGIVAAIVVLGIFVDDLPDVYRLLSHVVDGIVLLQLPVLVVQFVARWCLGEKSEIYRSTTSTLLDPCTEFCGEVARLLVAGAALKSNVSDKDETDGTNDISPRFLFRLLENTFSKAIESGALKNSDLERMGGILFRHLDPSGQDAVSCSDLAASSCSSCSNLPMHDSKWTDSLVRASNFLARDVGVSARNFRQQLDSDAAREQCNVESSRRNTLMNNPLVGNKEVGDTLAGEAVVDLKTMSGQSDKESNAKVSLQGLEDKVTDFLSQFLKRIEKLELHARELSDTLMRQVASLERRWSDAKQRIDSLVVNTNDPGAVSGKNILQLQSEKDEHAPTLLVHHQDLARRIDSLVCRIAALELSKAIVPGFAADLTNEHVLTAAGSRTKFKHTAVSEPAIEALPGSALKGSALGQQSKFRIQTKGVPGSVSAGEYSGLQNSNDMVTLTEGPGQTSHAAVYCKLGAVVTV